MSNRTHALLADDTNFDAVVLAARGPVLVDFGAAWCAPCRALEPIVERIAEELAGTCKVVKVDIDRSPEVARRYRVRSAPTLLVFRDGEKRAQHVGLTTRERVLRLLST